MKNFSKKCYTPSPFCLTPNKKALLQFFGKKATTLGLFLLLISASNLTNAQVSNYTFSAHSGTYTAISGGVDITNNIQYYANVKIPIGFNFNYNGVTYSKLAICEAGWASFDSTNVTADLSNSATNNLALGTTRNLVAPLWDFLRGSAAGAGGISKASYQVSGSAPNRVFTMEWLNWAWLLNCNCNAISFQAKLYEGTNIIEFVYLQGPGALTTPSASIGISGIGSGAGNFLSLNNTSTNPTASSTVETNTISIKPASGQIYRFSPPVPPKPIVESIVREIPSTAATSASEVVFRVSFDTTVIGVVASEFVLNSNVGGTIDYISTLSEKEYLVYISGLNNTAGTVGLSIKGVGGIVGTNNITQVSFSGNITVNQTATNDYLNQSNIGQTFKAVTNDSLYKVTFFTKSPHSFAGTANLKIYQGDESGGSATLLGTQVVTILNNTSSSGQSFIITTPISLTLGNTYSVVLDNFTGTGTHALSSTTYDSYTDGHVIFTGYNSSSHGNYDLQIQIIEGTSIIGLALDTVAPSVNETFIKIAQVIPTIIIDSTISCYGLSDGSATASATGGTSPYTYLWSNSGTTAIAGNLSAGTYTVTISDALGDTASASATITEPTLLVSTAIVDSNTTCNGLANGGATASALGGTAPYTYSWSNSATTASITGVIAGTYSVTITDKNGCTDSASAAITEPLALTASPKMINGTTITQFSENGDNTGLYSLEQTFIATDNGPLVAAIIKAAYYSGSPLLDIQWAEIWDQTSNVLVSNERIYLGGNIEERLIQFTNPAQLISGNPYKLRLYTGSSAAFGWASNSLNPYPGGQGYSALEDFYFQISIGELTDSLEVSCFNDANGEALVAVTNGVRPFQYTWSNSDTTSYISNLVAGSYSVTVTDSVGCTSSNLVIVTQPVSLVAASVVDSNTSCNGVSDGGATASATGGTMPYTYSWSNSATTASITGLMTGTYSVTITDANGCTDSTSTMISEPAILVATSVVDSNITCNGLSNGGATASSTGGTMPYTYSWSNTATTPSITGVTAATYTVTITDANGCTSTSSITITEPAILVAATVVDANISCNSLADGGATASATGGTMPYMYAWSNSATTASITGVMAGTYTVAIMDANGCSSTSSSTVTEPTLLVATTVIDSTISCSGGSNGAATTSTTGGIMPYTYTWSNSATTASITGVAAGTYTTTVTDNNGCTKNTSITLVDPASLNGGTISQ